MNFLVEVHLEREHYVVGVKRLTVREAQSVPQLHGESLAILRNAPRFGKGRLSVLGLPVDVNQVRSQPADDFPRRRIRRGDRVQRLRFTALRDNESATVAADLVVRSLQLFAFLERLGSRRRKTAIAAGKQEGGKTTPTMHRGLHAAQLSG